MTGAGGRIRENARETTVRPAPSLRSASASTAAASSGWENRTCSPLMAITSRPSAGRSRSQPSPSNTAATTGTVGSAASAVTRRASLVSRGSAARRPPSSSVRLAGTGSGSCGPEGSSRRSCSARASSSAKNGLPPDTFVTRRSAGRGSARPRRETRIRWSAPSVSGCSVSRAVRASSTPAMTESEDAGVRIVMPIATGSSDRRRSANPNAATEEASSHWTSSIATSNDP